MKRTVCFILMWILVSSCGVSSALITNQNQNSTQVVLAGNNFRIVQQVKGSAAVQYFFFMGGTWKGSLYARAYTEMLSKANLNEGSRAIVNLVTEENIDGLFPVYFLRTVTVSAQVIEFTGPALTPVGTE